MALSVGTKAPQFVLKEGSQMKDWDLSKNLDRPVVILFFPAAFSGVCTQEMCGFKNDYVISLEDATVVGISVDSPFTQDAWKSMHNIPVTLLSDYQQQVTKAYDVLLPDLIGLGPSAARAAFVVDTQGIIRYVEQTASPLDLPDFQRLLSFLKELGPAKVPS